MERTEVGRGKVERALGLDPEHPPGAAPEVSARQVAEERASRRRRRWQRRVRRVRRRLETALHRR